MRELIAITLFIFFSILNPLSAKRISVSSAYDINRRSTSYWNPGDTIVLQNGEWIDQAISLRANGTESNPIVLMAETPGSVIMKGMSRISISGSYVEISGIYFKEGTLHNASVVEFRTSAIISYYHANNCRMTNCAIIDYNPALYTNNTKWVSIYGQNNRVDNCSFVNKTNLGVLMEVTLSANVVPAHIIENNYFGYRNPNLDDKGRELNGQEIIRVGTSDVSMQDANCIIRNNFFEHCDGETEIVSNKSCGNTYSNNVFYECKGMLTLRHGNDCVVEGNYFFGNGVKKTGGVRIIGENHKVYNN